MKQQLILLFVVCISIINAVPVHAEIVIGSLRMGLYDSNSRTILYYGEGFPTPSNLVFDIDLSPSPKTSEFSDASMQWSR